MKPHLPLLCLASLQIASVASGAALLIDFGTTPATGQVTVNATAAPQLGGPAGLTGNLVYNTISGTDNSNTTTTFPSTYRYSDNSTATGVSVSIATGTAWNSMASGPAAFTRVGFDGARSGVGVFATPASPNNTKLFADFASAANASNTNDYIGLSIQGLTAGQYLIYAITNNTYLNATGSQTRQVRAGTGAVGLTDYSGFAAATTLSYDYTNIAADTATWAAAEGKYWTSFTVTLTESNNTLYLGGFKSGDNQGGLFNSVQIVAVPEPSAGVALVAGFGLLAVMRRRAR